MTLLNILNYALTELGSGGHIYFTINLEKHPIVTKLFRYSDHHSSSLVNSVNLSAKQLTISYDLL